MSCSATAAVRGALVEKWAAGVIAWRNGADRAVAAPTAGKAKMENKAWRT